MVELVCRLEKQYGISLDETIIGPDTTVEEIRALASRASQASLAAGTVRPARRDSPPMPRWARRFPIRLLRRILTDGIVLRIFNLFCRLEVGGIENLHLLQGPRILCANHQSDLDPLAILLALPGRYRKLVSPAMGLNRFHAYFQHLGMEPEERGRKRRKSSGEKTDRYRERAGRGLNPFAHHLGYFLLTLLFQTFPFPQGAAFRPSLEYTGELLDAGLWILIFPEGRVSSSRQMGNFKGGVSLIAEKTEVPVFPVSIEGMHEVLPPEHWWPRRGKVRIAFGEPLQYIDEGHERFARMLEKAVRALKEKFPV
jgi:long-chain acyl-CoA synthetase